MTEEIHSDDKMLEKYGIRLYCQNNVVIIQIRKDYIRTDSKNVQNVIRQIELSLDKLGIDSIEKEKIKRQISNLWLNLSKPRIEESDKNVDLISEEEWKTGVKQRYDDLRKIVKEIFPELWETMEFELAVKSILNIKDCNLPFAGIILGAPSSSKTLGIELLRDFEHAFYTDSFSPKSFVSHTTAVSKKDLEKIDLLPKIRNRLFLTPELSPTFSKKDDELIEILGIFIRILDGKGYESDTGAQGHRGYTGSYMFAWLGAAVDIPRKMQKYLSTLGPKLYFFRVPKSKKTEKDYLNQLEGEDFGIKFEKVKEKLNEYLDWFEQYHSEAGQEYSGSSQLVEIPWDKDKDSSKAKVYVIKLAKILAPLRGTLPTWETRETQGTDYAYSLPTIEEPDRAITQLWNLARGHALSQSRNYILIDDLPLIIKVVLSTATLERVKVLDLLIKRGGLLSTSEITKSLRTTNPTARRTMAEFKGLEIVDTDDDIDDIERLNNTEKMMTLKPEFNWFLSDEFKQLRDGFTPDIQQTTFDSLDTGNGMLKEKIPLSLSDSIEKNQFYECYYCDQIKATKDETEYKRHVVIDHPGKPAHPSMADLMKNSIKPQGKEWEI